jgi:spermidine synthase
MSESSDQLQRNQKIILFACFFLSGFSGLLYQVVWVRLAYAAFGIVTPVLSAVVSVFMIGLSLGAVIAGKFATYASKVLRVPAINLYAICELLIGVLAICVPALFQFMRHSLLFAGSTDSFSYMAFTDLAILLALLPCCFLMGCTYPLMLAYLRQVSADGGESFGFLYWANVMGAAAGAVSSAFIMIELLGFRHCLWFGYAFNFFASALSVLLSRKMRINNLQESCNMISERESRIKINAPITILLFLTGFISLALEVLWTRVFMPVLGTCIYGFAIILFVYLIATAMGSRRYLAERNDKTGPRIGTILVCVSISALLPVILNGFQLPLGISSVSVEEQKLRSLLAAVSIAPFCFFLGYLTPLLIDKESAGLPGVAGKLYAINSIAGILGPLFASYILLPLLGARLAQLLLALPFLVAIGWLAVRQRSKLMFLGTAISLVLLVVGSTLCGSYDEPRISGARIYRDYAATVVASGQERQSKLLVNGQPMTALVPFLKMMAHFPICLHDGPVKSSLVICLGMGTTFRSLLTWQHDTHAVELSAGVKSACVYFYPDLGNKMDKIIVDDGRRYLERTKQKFDIITIDPPPPLEAAGSSLLYSKEFCQVLKEHVNKGGLVQQFFPTDERVVRSAALRALKDCFPYVRIFRSSQGWGYHFIASDQPIVVPSVATIEKRLTPRVIADLLENADEMDQGKPLNQFKRMIYFEVPVQEILDNNPKSVITDDRALNEYCLLRRITDDRQDWDGCIIEKMPEELEK